MKLDSNIAYNHVTNGVFLRSSAFLYNSPSPFVIDSFHRTFRGRECVTATASSSLYQENSPTCVRHKIASTQQYQAKTHQHAVAEATPASLPQSSLHQTYGVVPSRFGRGSDFRIGCGHFGGNGRRGGARSTWKKEELVIEM